MSPLSGRPISAVCAALLLAAASPEAAKHSPILTAQVPAAVPKSSPAPGYFDLRNGVVGYIPPSLRPGERAPLLVLLHGASGQGADMVERFKDEADRRGVVLLAPKSGRASWDTVLDYNENSAGFAPIAKLPQTNPSLPFGGDVARVDRALALLFEHVAVDPGRIGLLGFSDGATYALALGCQNPRIFGSVIAVSAGFAFPTHAKGAQRIMVAHGTRDRALPFIVAKRDIVPNLKRHGYDVTFRRFEGGHQIPDEIAAEALDFFLDERAQARPVSASVPRRSGSD